MQYDDADIDKAIDDLLNLKRYWTEEKHLMAELFKKFNPMVPVDGTVDDVLDVEYEETHDMFKEMQYFLLEHRYPNRLADATMFTYGKKKKRSVLNVFLCPNGVQFIIDMRTRFEVNNNAKHNYNVFQYLLS